MRIHLLLLSAGFLIPLVSGGADLGPYQLILDKQLLGAEKVIPVTVTAPQITQATPSWSRDYRMTMITQDGDRVRVGLQNLKDQTSFLLIEGDEVFANDSLQLISGNYQRGTAIIRFRGSDHRFQIETGPSASAGIPEPGSRNSGGRENFPSNNQRRIIQPASPRRRETTPPQIRRFNSAAERDSHLQEVQKDAIRTGKPPLPIPLSPESDKQLVKEGVLPPRQ